MGNDWLSTFLAIAKAASGKSKDPSSKVGAVLIRPDYSVASLGFNGFPKRIADNPLYLSDPAYRDEKLKRAVHAEQNALRKNRDNTTVDYQMIVTRHPCAMCALEIACSDITDIWYLSDEVFEQRWHDSLQDAKVILGEAGIALHKIRL